MKEITDDDLILYLYQEAPPVLKALIEKEISGKKGNIQQRLQQLKETLGQLDQLKLQSPSSATIQTLLQKAGITPSRGKRRE
ncbi:MAG: hypothetical protein ACOVOY_00895 [Sediminibacterium sp.]|jgi:hypothetical protein